MGARPAAQVLPALVNGTAGVVIMSGGRPFAIMAFTISEDRIIEIDSIGDPDRVKKLTADLLIGADRADQGEP
jgi:hypothetical protein